MRYLLSLMFIVFTTLSGATQSYPSLFSTQGTPLFQATDKFEKLQKYDSLKLHVINYSKEVEKVKEIGYKADKSQNKKDIIAYLKSLRTLQKQYDSISKISMNKLLDSIKQNKYDEFSALVNSNIENFKNHDRLKNKVIAYYKKHRDKTHIPSLDRMIKSDSTSTKYYAKSTYLENNISFNNSNAVIEQQKEITVITKTNCSWCKKVKALLKTNGQTYHEIDLKSSEGSRLYKKYNGKGVPITIIDGKAITGYDKNGILQAIQ